MVLKGADRGTRISTDRLRTEANQFHVIVANKLTPCLKIKRPSTSILKRKKLRGSICPSSTVLNKDKIAGSEALANQGSLNGRRFVIYSKD